MYGTIQRFPPRVPARVPVRALVRYARPLGAWSDDARQAMTQNPDYFLWWYTVKSVGLGVVAAYAAYQLGRRHGERRAGAWTAP